MRIGIGFTTILAFVTCAALGQNPSGGTAVTSTITGEWSAENAFPDNAKLGNWPISLHRDIPTTFVFKVDGNNLTGKARVDACPGNGVITEGKIDGENVSFTVVTEDNSSSGPQTIYYSGKVHADEIVLSMRWPVGVGRTFEAKLKGKKVRQAKNLPRP